MSTLPETMLAARLHRPGDAMIVETLPVPRPRPTDVLVEVRACGVVPNLRNVLAHWQEWFPELPLPKLPAIFGLDVSGIVAATGELVQNFKVGDRVYANPSLVCGSCPACRADDSINCRNFTFRGYFGFGPDAQRQFDAYPYGGMGEYITAPQRNLVPLPGNVTFDQAARFGYLGTALAALRKARIAPGGSVLINGISGTLGLGACLLALAMGAGTILGTGRDQGLLDRVKALAPRRIHTFALGSGRLPDWGRGLTGGYGVDAAVDCLGPGAPGSAMMDAIYSTRRGGHVVNVGGVGEKVLMDVHWMMDEQISFIGSNWFTPGEGQMLADMAAAGSLDLSVFKHRRWTLAEAAGGLDGVATREGGFTNFVVVPPRGEMAG